MDLASALPSTITGTAPNRRIALFNRQRSNFVFGLVGTNDAGRHFHVGRHVEPAKLAGDEGGALRRIDAAARQRDVAADVFVVLSDNFFSTIAEIA